MSDSSFDRDPDVGGEPGPTGTPRWVKVFGVVALVLVLIVIVGLVTGGHGPSRHMPSGDAGTSPGSAPPDHKPPGGKRDHRMHRP
jgi:hypothetical protein